MLRKLMMPCVFAATMLVGASAAPGLAQERTTSVTYYHSSLHGGIMRCGGTYNRWDQTIAASNWYPCGTRLLVTRTSTGESIEVTVRDTGSARLTVDLSEAGFQQLGSLSEGRINVTVDVIR